MAGRWKDFDADHAVDLRRSGLGVVAIAERMGVGYERIRKALVAAGVSTKSNRIRANVAWDDVAAAYAGGESVLSLSKRFGVTRDSIVRRVGVGRRARGRSEAERLKWERIKSTPGAVERQCAAAWAASRGTPKSEAAKRKAAVTNFLRQTRRGTHEDALACALQAVGLDVTQQRPVDCYNLDVALDADRIAVEVIGTHPKSRGTVPHAERVPKILDADWRILYVGTLGKRAVDMPWLCQQILAFRDFARGLEPGLRRQWMVFSDRKDSARVRAKLHELSGVPCSAYPEHVT